eukprot:scaffold1681_cov242-Prasinococcus_capsulatus_cf.AAC.6
MAGGCCSTPRSVATVVGARLTLRVGVPCPRSATAAHCARPARTARPATAQPCARERVPPGPGAHPIHPSDEGRVAAAVSQRGNGPCVQAGHPSAPRRPAVPALRGHPQPGRQRGGHALHAPH